MHVADVSVLEGELALSDLRANVLKKIHRIPNYRRKLAFVPLNLAHPKWVDDANFDIDYHINEQQLSETKKNHTIETALDCILELNETPLAREHPLWRVWLIRGISGHTVLLHIVHQALVDEIGGVRFADLIADLQQQPSEVPQPPEWQPDSEPGATELATEAIAENTRSYAEAGRILQNFSAHRREMLRRATETMTRFTAEPVVRAPWNRHGVGQRRSFAWRRFSYAALRQVRNRSTGTVNDVVLSIVTEAAARYMAAKNITLQDQHIRLMCPVTVRREDAAGARRNRAGAIFPVLSAQPMKMLDRLKGVHWENETIKQNREAQALQLVAELAPPTPPMIMMGGQMVSGALQDGGRMVAQMKPVSNLLETILPNVPNIMPMPQVGFNFVCSTIPGMQTTHYIAGHRIIDRFNLQLLTSNLGYGVTIGTYNQSLYVGLTADPELLEDVDAMADLIDETYAELLEAVEIDIESVL